MKRIILLGILLMSTAASALNFSVYPTKFLLDGTKISTEEITITNNTLEPLRVEIYPEGDKEYGEEFNLNSNITIFPKNVSIKPGASQKVRFRVKSDEKIKNGEFKSDLIFKEIPYEIKTTKTKEENSTEIVSNLQIVTELAIPVYTQGKDIKLDAQIKNLTFKYNGSEILIVGDTSSKGNASTEFIYSIEVDGKKYSGRLGNSARVGDKRLSLSIPVKENLKGKKANIKVIDQSGKEHYKKYITF